jgi:hypothetical protein
MLLGTNHGNVEELARAVERAGAQYGLALHWGKTQALSIGTSQKLRRPDGSPIEDSGSMLYLGAQISGDGRVDSELSRRIGLAAGEYRALQKLWGHTSVTAKEKLSCLQTFVISKLVYGLGTCWFCKAQRRRLDGFYVRCIRRILHIPAAYYSRISNHTVLQRAGVRPLTEQLAKQQASLFSRVARSSVGDPLRRNALADEGAEPKVKSLVRRIGRPRQTWIEQLSTRAPFHSSV